MADLSADIQRYLDNLPVLAGAPSGFYRLRKFAQRNRVSVSAAVLVFVSLVILGVREWQAANAVRTALVKEKKALASEKLARTAADNALAREKQALDKAQRALQAEQQALAAEKAARTAADRETAALRSVQALMQAAIRQAAPEDGGKDATIAQFMDAATALIGQGLQKQPRVEVEVRTTIGATYLLLDMFDKAQAQLRRALELAEPQFGQDHPQTLVIVSNLGRSYTGRRMPNKAIPFLRRALKGYEQQRDDTDPEQLRSLARARMDLANCYWMNGDYAAAETGYRKALKAAVPALGRTHPTTIALLGRLGIVLRDRGKLEESEQRLRQARDLARQHLGARSGRALTIAADLGRVLSSRGKRQEALRLLEEAVEGLAKLFGEDNPKTLTTRSNYAVMLAHAGKLEPAIETGTQGPRRHRRSGTRPGPSDS